MLTLPVVLNSQVFINRLADVANQIGISGLETNSKGVSGYQTAGNTGHSLVSQNPSGSVAFYAISGRESSPTPGGATVMANGTGNGDVSGFTNLITALTSNGKDSTNLGLITGAVGGLFDNSYNLGADTNALNPTTGAQVGTLGVDSQWSAWSGSTLEERYYSANQAEVFYALVLDGSPIVQFGYAPIWMSIDYNNAGVGDDVIFGHSGDMTVTKEAGLVGVNSDIADAFMLDVNNAGGLVRVSNDTIQSAVSSNFIYQGQFGGYFSLSGRLQAVPEPSTYALIISILSFGLILYRRFKK